MRVLVTGASGFVGRATCRELQERGHEVIALVRRPGSEPPGASAVEGDISKGDESSLNAPVAEARPDAIIHLAAEIASQRDQRKVLATNVDGTRRVAAAAKASGTDPKLVFCSTVVTGDAHGELLEPGKPLPVETPYGESKQEAEKIALESGLDAVIVRPSHVYGPGGWYEEEFVKRLRQPGRFAVIGEGDNWWDVVRVGAVAPVLGGGAEGAPAGAVYHVADDEPIKFYDFVALTARELGVGPPRRIPVWLATLAAGSNAVRAAVRSARSSNARIKVELGWQPAYPTAAEGVPDAIAKL